MKLEKVYCLKIATNIGHTNIYGTKNALELFVSQWEEAIKNPCGDPQKVILSISGYDDDFARSEAVLNFIADNVLSCFLTGPHFYEVEDTLLADRGADIA